MKSLLVIGLVAVGLVTGLRGQDYKEFKSADELWAHIQKIQQGPATRPTTREEMEKVVAEIVVKVEPALAHFVKSYPEDARSWPGRMMLAKLAMMRDKDGKAGTGQAEAERLLKDVAAAKSAPAEARTQARVALIQLHAEPVGETPTKAGLESLDKEIAEFVKETADPQADAFGKAMRVQVYGRWNDPQAEKVLQELATDKNEEVAQMARRQLSRRELRSKPIELKFTALDGKEVDVVKLRGKVVLLDFWATWCGPCREELPNVLAVYKKYHDKGFEIIGISLDEEKDDLLAFLKKNAMTWPQYFDGKGWGNEISSKFGISGIPAMWLLDKKGMVHTDEARGEKLGTLIEKLLAE